MGWKLPNNCQETSETIGTGTVAVLGAVSGHLAFASQLVNNDTFIYVMREGANLEIGFGTYLTGPARVQRDTVIFSTAGGAKINWLAGTRDVYAAAPGELFGDLFDPSGGTGILVQDGSLLSLVRRAVALTGSGPLTISNGNGVSGNPTIDQAALGTALAAAAISPGVKAVWGTPVVYSTPVVSSLFPTSGFTSWGRGTVSVTAPGSGNFRVFARGRLAIGTVNGAGALVRLLDTAPAPDVVLRRSSLQRTLTSGDQDGVVEIEYIADIAAGTTMTFDLDCRTEFSAGDLGFSRHGETVESYLYAWIEYR